MKNIIILAVLIYLTLSITGCSLKRNKKEDKESYKSISQKEAKEMMDKDSTMVIVDVRTVDEYESGHIKNAIVFPNESITEENALGLFPNKDQVILVYCRSGSRSKQASNKLASYGYTQIFEFGGITSWPYD